MFIRYSVLKPIFKPIYPKLLSLIVLLSASFTQAATVLVHGDSLSAGYGMRPEQNWVTLLAEHYNNQHRIINSSISGETSQGGLNRLPDLLKAHQPDVVILELGANDGLRGYPITHIEGNLQQMIDLTESSGAQIILLGIRLPPNFGRRYTEPFYNNYATLAQRNKVSYLPFLLDDIAQHPELMQPDGLHPTATAQPQIMKNVLPVIEQVLKNL